jgi:hypothetical protein
LVESGVALYWWENPDRSGERFENVLPGEIYAADRFVAIHTPHYLSSPWCQREFNLALQIENVRPGQFIRIVRPRGVEVERPGWSGEYATIRHDPGAAALTVDALLAGVSAAPAFPRLDRPAAKWAFRNREEELDLVGGELTTDGGTDVWLVSAPPKLGKSWLLYELVDHVTRAEPSCTVRLLNLSDCPQSVRGDCVQLLTTLFDLGARPSGETTPEVVAALGPAVSELCARGDQQMYLLDGANLLETGAVRDLRTYLARIFELLRDRGGTTRIRVVISGRQVDEWRPVPGVRSRKLPLTGFTESVLSGALTDLHPPQGLGDARLAVIARRAQQMCEGLPDLLVPILNEIDSARFVGMDDGWWQEIYERNVIPYVRNQLLSVDNLFPAGGRELRKARADIEATLRRLVVYRIVTRSTLDHLDALPVFRELRATALFGQVAQDPWDAISPPIRRLLYRYYYPDEADRVVVETEALAYYRGWVTRSAEREQPVVLLECIWHEAARRSTGLAEEPIHTLPDFAAGLAAELLNFSQFGVDLVVAFTERLLDNDLELQAVLEPHPTLFEAVVTAVRAAIEARGDG